MIEPPPFSPQYGERDLIVVIHSMAEKYARDLATYTILRNTINRDLERFERFALPPKMRLFTRDELKEQIDSWGSLIDQEEYLLKKLCAEQIRVSSPMMQRKREAGEAV